jgi:type IV pilus assembly protein PilC
MPVFQYVADSQGVEIKDEIEALSEKEAISKIRTMGYFPTKVRPKSATKGGAGKAGAKPKRRRGAGARVKVKNVTQFARQLSTLQDAGLPILRSLRILEEQQKAGSFKRIIGYVADDIEGGSTLSEAFAKYPHAFDRLFVNMVAAGEAGGVLDLILARIADFKEKAIRLKGRVKGAMIYPVVVMTAAFGIVLGLMTFVIPTFQGVLQEMVGGKLNPVTTTVLAISDWIAHRYGWAILAGVPVGIVVLIRLTQDSAGPLRAGYGHPETAGHGAVVEQDLDHAVDENAGHPDQRRRADPRRHQRDPRDRRQRSVRENAGERPQLHPPG